MIKLLVQLLLNHYVMTALNDLPLNEYDMTIYQVLDEQNDPVFEAESFVLAQQEAELLNHSFDDHYFFVETVAAEQAY